MVDKCKKNTYKINSRNLSIKETNIIVSIQTHLARKSIDLQNPIVFIYKGEIYFIDENDENDSRYEYNL